MNHDAAHDLSIAFAYDKRSGRRRESRIRGVSSGSNTIPVDINTTYIALLSREHVEIYTVGESLYIPHFGFQQKKMEFSRPYFTRIGRLWEALYPLSQVTLPQHGDRASLWDDSYASRNHLSNTPLEDVPSWAHARWEP